MLKASFHARGQVTGNVCLLPRGLVIDNRKKTENQACPDLTMKDYDKGTKHGQPLKLLRTSKIKFMFMSQAAYLLQLNIQCALEQSLIHPFLTQLNDSPPSLPIPSEHDPVPAEQRLLCNRRTQSLHLMQIPLPIRNIRSIKLHMCIRQRPKLRFEFDTFDPLEICYLFHNLLVERFARLL